MRPIFMPDRLRERRELLGISQAEASRLLGVSKSGYFYYESGERNPTLPILERIAQVFKTDVNYLTGASDDPEPKHLVIRDRELIHLIREIQDTPKEDTEKEDYLIQKLSAYIKKRKQPAKSGENS